MLCSSSLRVRSLFGLVAGLAGLMPSAPLRAESITGVCPDGSIFIVQSPADVPCREAKRVEPHQVPPLHPEFLPRPYAWDVFKRGADANNPYNLVGTATQQAPQAPQAAAAPPRTGGAPEAGATAPPRAETPAPTPVSVASAEPPRAVTQVSLSPSEVAQLAAIIEAWQAHAPATLVRAGKSEPQGMLLRVARSAALEGRVAEALTRQGLGAHGPVLAFEAKAVEPGDFYATLTFVQGHIAFHPDPGDPLQFGMLSGAQGPLGAGQTALGYVVLPARVDLAQPLDIYWDDRRISATLQPGSGA
jgi:hypothetical protein